MRALALFLAAALWFGSVCAAVPETITYQGYLTDPGGTPVNTTVVMTFRLYSVASGGSALWTETQLSVDVNNGLFNAVLGSMMPLTLPFDIPYWLSIAINSDGEMNPRQPLMSSPYALRSANADTLAPAASVTGSQITGAITGGTIPGSQVTGNIAGSQITGVITGGTVPGSQIAGAITGGTIPGSQVTGNISGSQITGTISNATVPGAVPWVVVSGSSQQTLSHVGYIVTGGTLATLTLPPSPTVGDVVKVSSPYSGGFALALNAGQTIEGINIWMASTWIPRDSVRGWSSVASSADGTKLVATVHGGLIYTSTDSGVTWTPRGITENWFSGASSADGTKLVVVAGGGQIYTSTDSGATWTWRGNARSWRSVASSANGTKLVAIVENGQIYTSTDSGVNWTPREIARQWNSVASSADGTKLVAVVNNGQIYTLPSAPFTGPQYSSAELVYAGSGRWLVVNQQGPLTSP